MAEREAATWANGWAGRELTRESAQELADELNTGPGPVLQGWLCDRPWTQQSMVLSALRGPEDPRAKAVKAVVRWLRQHSLRQAVPGHEYMRVAGLPRWQDVAGECEWLSGHYVGHLHRALSVVALGHPEPDTVSYAARVVAGIAAILGFHPPEPSEFNAANQDATTVDGRMARQRGADLAHEDRRSYVNAILRERFDMEEE